MRVLKLIDKFILRLSEGVVVLMTLIMILSAAVQIISRMIFSSPVSWTDELCRTTAVWATTFAAAIAARTDSHVTMTIFRDLLPKKHQKILARVCALFVIAFACVTLIYGWKLCMSSMVAKTAGLKLRKGIMYLCIPISSFITIFNSVLFVFSLPEKFDRPQQTEGEVEANV